MLKVLQGILTHPKGIADGAVLSHDELLRYGLTEERIGDFMNRVLRPATEAEVDAALGVAGLTRQQMAEKEAELRSMNIRYQAEFHAIESSPPHVARLLLKALRDWRDLEAQYLAANRTASDTAYGGPVPWADHVIHGFRFDELRSRMRILRDVISGCVQNLLRSIAELPGIEATRLQQFVRSKHLSTSEPDPYWHDAEMLAEMLPFKLEDLERARPQPVSIVDQAKPIEATLLETPIPWWRQTWVIVCACAGIVAAALLSAFGEMLWTRFFQPFFGRFFGGAD